MKILLLGATGQLGSDILRANKAASSPLEIVPVTRRELDVSNVSAIAEVLSARDFNVLINCIGHKADEIEANGSLAVAVNAHAVKAIAEACKGKRARFVHISSDFVFGAYNADTPLRENDPPAPINVYGATKLLGENLARISHNDVVILRTACLFGVAGVHGKGDNFVETVIRLGRERGALRVVDDQTMSPTSTADLAGWLLSLLRARAAVGVYHAVNTGVSTWFEFAKTIIERTGIAATLTPVTRAEYPTIALRPPYSALNNSKLAAVVGPIRPWGEALDDYLRAKGHIALRRGNRAVMRQSSERVET